MQAVAEVSRVQFGAASRRQLVEGVYHDIGMAAVADALALQAEALDPMERQSIRRGAHYAHMMPGRPSARKAI